MPAPAGAACRGADRVVSGKAGLAGAGEATLCLLNAERRIRRLRPLRSQRTLARAAAAYSREMVRRKIFRHGDFLRRLRPYVRGWPSYRVGENLAVGPGDLATPREIVRGWMRSRGHRANILARGFDEIGVGIAVGTPTGGPGGTWTTDFGYRRRK